MVRMGLARRFFLPVGAILALVMALVTYGVTEAETARAVRAFEDNLTAIALASRSMVHATAEEFCKSRGMEFHRVLLSAPTDGDPDALLTRDALKAFAQDPKLGSYQGNYTQRDGTPTLQVLAPARLEETCITCHEAFGMGSFKANRVGDLVGAFGVSISTADLVRSERNSRIWAAGGGIAVLVVLSLVIHFFVRRIIVVPLQGLSRTLDQMAGGDLRVRAPQGREDELGHLAEAFNGMAARLHETLAEVHTSSERVASGSVQLGTSAEEMLKTVAATARLGEELQGAGRQVLEAVQRLNRNVEAMADFVRTTAEEAHGAVVDADRVAEGLENIVRRFKL